MATDGTAKTGREIATIEGEYRVVTPLVDADTALEQWQAYQALSARLLTDGDYQTYEDFDRKTGKKVMRRFKKKQAFRKLATFFGLSLETIDQRIGHRHSKETCPRLMGINDPDCGCPTVYARIVVRATAPNGRTTEGVGISSLSEPRRFTKPEHEIPATAFTRAANRAISDMIGAGEDSAEEVRGTSEAPPGLPLEVQAGVARAWKAAPDDRRLAAAEWVKGSGFTPAAKPQNLSGDFMRRATEEQIDTLLIMLRDPTGEADFDPDNVPADGGEEATT